VLTRQELGFDSTAFGVLVGRLGFGAILGGFVVIPLLPKKISVEWRVGVSTVIFAGLLATLAYESNIVVLCLAMIAGGIAKLIITSNLNFSSYSNSPKWIGSSHSHISSWHDWWKFIVGCCFRTKILI
jgi:hypothetical protein